jgi:membrane protein DedA with SNARE-associated domain
MNVFQLIGFAIWGPIMAVVIPLVFYGSLASRYAVSLFDHIIIVFFLLIIGIVVGDIISVAIGRITVRIV